MFTNPLTRLLVGVAIAIPIVYLLFIVMSQLISVKEVNLEKGEQRVLTAITPQQQDSEVRTRQRSKPKRIDSAKKPPPPPKVSATKSNINLPTPQIEGAAPTELNLGRMQSLAIDPVAISDRDAQPIRPPVPTYPQRAAERGIEGSCEVRFDVDTRGKPYNIQATCSDNVFKREAERAVGRVEFAPKIVRGKAAERRNVVYPLEFKLQ
ncbi:energy transducer TonB [Hyphomonas sp.]|uniref:energy transducer TonB n=1 Tax=Hyphomonas sp. TaxID=87 RepID=UPI000C63BC02|nr:energy transducer TonB [Hyphomonas sp.]MAB11114.1 energy transducer TonB [Hyphomonas sp.]MAU67601.1 energy transducer TonB [Hyphomonas sp.]